jgi:hypothetical protein
MIKRTIALATLASFLVFSWSCIYSWQKTPIQSLKPEKRTGVKISAVQEHSGRRTEFGKKPGARIQGDSIVGEAFMKNFVLEKSKIRYPDSLKSGVPVMITTTDGKRYSANRILTQDDISVTFDAYVPFSIPLEDVGLVWIWKVNVLATLLLDVVLPLGILLALAAASMSGGFNMSGGWGGNWFGTF